MITDKRIRNPEKQNEHQNVILTPRSKMICFENVKCHTHTRTAAVSRLIFSGSFFFLFSLAARNLLRAINICIRPIFVNFSVQIHTTSVLFATMQIMLCVFLFRVCMSLFYFCVYVCCNLTYRTVIRKVMWSRDSRISLFHICAIREHSTEL